jgi:hypothetical protein
LARESWTARDGKARTAASVALSLI